MWIACVASVSVGLSAGLKHFSLLERTKIGASAKKYEKMLHVSSNMDNFKFNFLSRGQFENVSIDSFSFTVFIQNVTMLRVFFGNFIFALIARTFS